MLPDRFSIGNIQLGTTLGIEVIHLYTPVGMIAICVATSNMHAPSNSWYTSHPRAHTSLTGYNTEIVPVFDPRLSPRNLVIIATHT